MSDVAKATLTDEVDAVVDSLSLIHYCSNYQD